ncbi:hypothetical protein [Serratia marcescens]|uniref:hypothetical protein n=1 Tax=Serratia marcescens TaxID=615 RepID=UPI0018D9451C|nr:hypothetical protein [Serratia marcescens]MBH2762323.1 hypothetical protein [Serratia marcescens]
MKSNMTYTAMRVKQFGYTPAVEVTCYDERAKQKTECLLIFKTLDEVIFYGTDNFHPLIKAEMREVAIEAISIGMGKAQIEAKQKVVELESSRKRQVSRARQFRTMIEGWSGEISSLNEDIRHGLDTPTIRTRLSTLSKGMMDYNPNK